MSFKREGNDTSQLNILKKRRVADLLSNFIPEDEAALMKNGRYTCLVCSYRPVFDTADTLTVHRNGKRHLEGLKSFYGKKARLRNEIAKRHHETYVQTEDTRQGQQTAWSSDRQKEPSCAAPLLAQTQKLTHHALLKTVPYNSCHTKTSTKSGKVGLSVGSSPRDDSSSKMTSEQEKTWRKPEVANSASQSTSGGCTSANEGSHPNIKGSQAAVRQEEEPITAQRRRELEHYLKLKSDGWLQDRSGQWVRDENVEFDSDEEAPASLAPPPTSH